MKKIYSTVYVELIELNENDVLRTSLNLKDNGKVDENLDFVLDL